MPKYFVLALDGGGIRGVVSARILERIVAKIPDFVSKVDLFGGTSAGAINGVVLAQGKTPTDLVALYKNQGPNLLKPNPLSLGRTIEAGYTTEGRLDGLRPTIGDGTLATLNKNVVIVSFELDSENPLAPNATPPRRWKPKVFHNYPGPESDGNTTAIDAVMRSSAAPTYFPIYQGFVDGAVVANNPSMCAVAQAISPSTGKQQLSDIYLVSIGTGTKPQFLTETNSNWGIAEWNFKLLDILLEGSSGIADYQCAQLLGDCYLRIDLPLTENIAIDDAGSVDKLIGLVDALDLTDALSWIDKNWV